ncbi:hypothetical protein SEA_SHAM_259 [Streptomyces phage Sham]|nr:hypothetical protein SEA_SHAM_259 [Streptomyces phage Sham]
MRQTATHGHSGWFGCQREGCPNLPAVYGTYTRCRCEGWQTQNQGKCTACNSPVLADWEWEEIMRDFGRVVVKEMQEVFPVTITAYRGEKAFKVYGVIEDSISSKVDRNGNVTLSFETLQSKDEIGYIPCIDWYTTELES